MARITKHNLNDRFNSLLNNPNRYSGDKFEVYDTNTGKVLSPQDFVSNARTFNVSNDDILKKAQTNQYIFRKKDNGTSNQNITQSNSNSNQVSNQGQIVPEQLSNQLGNSQYYQPLPNHLGHPLTTSYKNNTNTYNSTNTIDNTISASNTLSLLTQWLG